MENKIKILKEPDAETQYFVIDKPSGLPSAPISKDDRNNAFWQAAELYPQLLDVKGKKDIEYGLLHRLDTVTSGLILIAATQNAYDQLIELQKNNKIKKYYKAVCRYDCTNILHAEGFPPHINYSLQELKDATEDKAIKIESYFRPFGLGRKEVRPVTEYSGAAALKKLGQKKIYSTEIIKVDTVSNSSKLTVYCKILNGFRHQIRCHLSWCGLPIDQDAVYDFKKDKAANNFSFTAYKLIVDNKTFTQKET